MKCSDGFGIYSVYVRNSTFVDQRPKFCSAYRKAFYVYHIKNDQFSITP